MAQSKLANIFQIAKHCINNMQLPGYQYKWPVITVISRCYCTILLAQHELAKASGLALNTKPMLKI